MSIHSWACAAPLLLLCSMARAAELPVVRLDAHGAVITRSCRIEIAPGAVVEDPGGNGAIRVEASDITIEFAPGSELRGSPAARRPDEYKGYGIRLNGQKNVRIRKARISGFWCGLWATKADGLALEGIDASDNRRAYLHSTPVAEDGADWLFPHDNEDYGWLKQYAAALYIDQSAGVTVRNCRVWHGQNALCIDRVRDSRIYDNDFSFNSGWGIAMWRCEGNTISRNAIDFCVRGYSHNVYNRGQDSAGILMFEQNNRNVIAENSVTHGGDCFFGFAGREAIGEAGTHPADWYKRRGNNDNQLIGNDLSYAPAHGIEMTFSFGNQFINNRMADNAICGIWGGYSSDTFIYANTFEANGGMGYGLERGGINIEHGHNNRVLRNTFINNKCGVHYWANPESGMGKRPWGQANGVESKDNLIAGNTFTGDNLVFHFRGPGEVTIGQNEIVKPGREIQAEPAHHVQRDSSIEAPMYKLAMPTLYGNTHPVGARPELRGRDKIIMTEWGPWDHRSPLVQLVEAGGSKRTYWLHNMDNLTMVETRGEGVEFQSPATPVGKPRIMTVTAKGPGIHPFSLRAVSGDYVKEIHDSLVAAMWDATFFNWPKDVDPRQKLEEWRKLAASPAAVSVQLDNLTLKYGQRGPSDLHLSPRLDAAKLGADYFGMIARTSLPMPKGKWRFKTTSDDGVRVRVDGKPVIDNWTWHVPTVNEGTLELAEDKTVEIVVEHFEIDGVAAMELEIAPAK